MYIRPDAILALDRLTYWNGKTACYARRVR